MRTLFLGFLLAGATPALAAEYRFVTLEFPPLEFTNDRGEPEGAAVQIVSEVMTKLGHKVTVDILPWSRSLNLVRSGKADGIFTCYRLKERDAFLEFSNEDLVSQVVALYVKKDGDPGLRTFNGDFRAIKDKTFGTLNTISYGARFDKARAKLKLKTERVESLDLAFKMLAAGRIDYVISNRYSAEVTIETMKLRRDIREVPSAVEVTPSYVAFSKKRKLTALRDAFDRELRVLKSSGRYQEILDKFRVRAPAVE